jgi:hypothetical protein
MGTQGFTLLSLLAAAAAQPASPSLALARGFGPGRSCPATPLEDRLPELVAPMAGASPLWLVDGSGGVWSGEESPVKSLWVVSAESAERVHVRGRRLDGEGRLAFRARPDGPVTDELVIPDPRAAAVVPGGATREVMASYVFVPSYILYPSPGCWTIEARVGGREVRIIVAVGEPKHRR